MNILNNKYVSDYLEKNSDLVDIIKSYLNILNDKKYSLEAKGGNIDVSLNSNEYIFNLEQLIFAGEIPATENTPEIKSQYTVNGKLKLQGRNFSLSKNVYNNITVDFDVNSIFKFQDSISSSNVLPPKKTLKNIFEV